MSPEPSSLTPGLSPWLPHSWQLASPQTSDILSGGLHPVGSLARDTESAGILAEEANLVLTTVPDARWVLCVCVWGCLSVCLSVAASLTCLQSSTSLCLFPLLDASSPDFYPTLRGGPGNRPKPDSPCGFLICVSKTFLSPNCLLFGLMMK